MGATVGVILFAHGSRDPLWRQPIERVAARVREHARQALVTCAYLELTEPDLGSATTQLLAQGVRSIRVVPMFLGMGRHAREDLPRLLGDFQRQYPDTHLILQPAIGEDPRLIDLMARIALS